MSKSIPGLTAATLPVDTASLFEISIPGGGSRKISLADAFTTEVTKAISSADILALPTTPVVIVPAQGAGTIILLEHVRVYYFFGTAPYAGGDLDIFYEGDSSGFFGTISGAFRAIESSLTFGPIYSAYYGAGTPFTDADNKGIVLTTLGAAYADGDGTARIVASYKTITVPIP